MWKSRSQLDFPRSSSMPVRNHLENIFHRNLSGSNLASEISFSNNLLNLCLGWIREGPNYCLSQISHRVSKRLVTGWFRRRFVGVASSIAWQELLVSSHRWPSQSQLWASRIHTLWQMGWCYVTHLLCLWICFGMDRSCLRDSGRRSLLFPRHLDLRCRGLGLLRLSQRAVSFLLLILLRKHLLNLDAVTY